MVEAGSKNHEMSTSKQEKKQGPNIIGNASDISAQLQNSLNLNSAAQNQQM